MLGCHRATDKVYMYVVLVGLLLLTLIVYGTLHTRAACGLVEGRSKLPQYARSPPVGSVKESLTVNIFTNCVHTAPDTSMIERVLSHFNKTWGISATQLHLTFYVDPSPLVKAFPAYRSKLKRFGKVIQTRGFADAFYKSLKQTPTKYAFQLEHDWIFQAGAIPNSLEEILAGMEELKLDYLRFNKKRNKFRWKELVWETCSSYYKVTVLPMFTRNGGMVRSNNPHIIDVSQYQKHYANAIAIRANESFGVEEPLSRPGSFGYLYGGIGHAPTIIHLDGRNAYTI